MYLVYISPTFYVFTSPPTKLLCLFNKSPLYWKPGLEASQKYSLHLQLQAIILSPPPTLPAGTTGPSAWLFNFPYIQYIKLRQLCCPVDCSEPTTAEKCCSGVSRCSTNSQPRQEQEVGAEQMR